MNLYEYVVIYNPKCKEKKAEAKILVPITQVLVDSEETARKMATRDIPKEYEQKLEECEVRTRPF